MRTFKEGQLVLDGSGTFIGRVMEVPTKEGGRYLVKDGLNSYGHLGMYPDEMHPCSVMGGDFLDSTIEPQEIKGDEYLIDTYHAYLVALCDMCDELERVFPVVTCKVHLDVKDPLSSFLAVRTGGVCITTFSACSPKDVRNEVHTWIDAIREMFSSSVPVA